MQNQNKKTMLLSAFNGVVLGIGIKLTISFLTLLSSYSNLDKKITEAILINREPTILGSNLGLFIIISSVGVAIVLDNLAKKRLIITKERRFSSRISILIFCATFFNILQINLPRSNNFEFLWALSLIEPDTIITLTGWPINLLAILTLTTYLIYTVLLSMRRQSIDLTMHISCTLTVFFLLYNTSCGFYLFWLIQSISLLWLAKNLIKIKETPV